MYSQLLNWTLPAALGLTRSRYWRIAREIRRRQYWPRERLRAWQNEQLRQLLRSAEQVPFYQQRFREAGLKPRNVRSFEDLRVLPPTTKSDVQRHFPDEMTASRERDPDWRIFGTRGTTNRLMVIHDFQRRDHARATLLVVMTEDCAFRLGDPQVAIPPDACSAVCGREGMRERSVARQAARMLVGRQCDAQALSDLRGLVMNNWIERVLILEPFGPEGTHISEERLERYVRRIRDARASLLFALPEYLQALGSHVESTRAALPRLKVIRPMGANLDAVTRRRIETAFSVPVREHYGSLELGGIAFDCERRLGMHVLEDQMVLEVVRGGEAAPEGELGSLLVTDLHNRVMPLIRYQIGDIGSLTRGACSCGRTTTRLELEGRLEDTLVTQDGRLVTPERLARAFCGQTGIEQFQLVEQRSGRCELRYVPGPTGVDLNQLETTCRSLWGQHRLVRFRPVTSIRPEESGKFRHCKSSSFERLNAAPRPPHAIPLASE